MTQPANAPTKLVCRRCSYEWWSFTTPKACARCKSYQWQTVKTDARGAKPKPVAPAEERMMETTLSELTIEHLGNSATQGDLDKFRWAVLTAMERLNMDERTAINYVWNDGDYVSVVYKLLA